MSKKKIFLDTNFLLIPGVFGVDIFAEIWRICDFPYRLCIIEKSREELAKIQDSQRGKHKQAAKLALSLLRAHPVHEVRKEQLSVDDALVQAAQEPDSIVATQDRALQKRLEPYKTPIIVLRKKKYLILRIP